MESAQLQLCDFAIISFSGHELGLIDPSSNPISATNGDSFLCCFSVHFHVESSNG